MSGNSSGLPISQSLRNFYKKTEKSLRKSKNQWRFVRFSVFSRWRCELQPSVKNLYTFRSPFFYTAAETRIFWKFALVIEIWKFPETYQHILSPCRFEKTLGYMLWFSKIFSFFFLILFGVSGFIFLEISSWSEGFESQLFWKFWENSPKIWRRFSCFLTLTLYVI